MFWGPLTLSETDAIYQWTVCNGFFIPVLDPEAIRAASLMLCTHCLKAGGTGQLYIFFTTVTQKFSVLNLPQPPEH